MSPIKKKFVFPTEAKDFVKLAKGKQAKGEYAQAADYYYKAEKSNHDINNLYNIALQMTLSGNPKDSLRFLFENFPIPNKRPIEVWHLIRDNYRRMHQFLHERLIMLELDDMGEDLEDLEANESIVNILADNELVLNDTVTYGWDLSLLTQSIGEMKPIMALSAVETAKLEMLDFYDLALTKRSYEALLPQLDIQNGVSVPELTLISGFPLYLISCVTSQDPTAAVELIERLEGANMKGASAASVCAYSIIAGLLEKNQEIYTSLCENSVDIIDNICVARMLLFLKQPQKAIKFAKRVQSRYPYNRSANHMLAICQYSVGEYKSAYDCYERILSMFPEDYPAAQYRDCCIAAMNGNVSPVNDIPAEYTLWVSKAEETCDFVADLMGLKISKLAEELMVESNRILLSQLIPEMTAEAQLECAKKLVKVGGEGCKMLITKLLLNPDIRLEAKDILVESIAQNSPDTCVAIGTAQAFFESYTVELDTDDVGYKIYPIYKQCFDKALKAHGAVCAVAVNELFRYFSFLGLSPLPKYIKNAIAPIIHSFAADMCGIDTDLEKINDTLYGELEYDQVEPAVSVLAGLEEEYIHEIFGDM